MGMQYPGGGKWGLNTLPRRLLPYFRAKETNENLRTYLFWTRR